jgi:nifR3 family TIM-barrel protein
MSVGIKSETGRLPSFSIGRVPIYGDLILAPMAGYGDLPTRALYREMGSAYSFAPCVLDDGVLRNPRGTSGLIEFVPEERPVALQLLGSDAPTLVGAARALMALRPDIIDLNAGCPARRVFYRGRGAALLQDPAQLGDFVRQLATALPVPVTVKIRLGWDDATRNYLEVAHILEESGAAAISVHGRTKEQGYSGVADWRAIGEVVARVRVPVLANGDVRTVADIDAIVAQTGCAGVLIGRGAVGNPWLFQRRDMADVSWTERVAMVRRHLAAMQDYYGDEKGLMLFRKHVAKYVQAVEGANELRPRLMEAQTAATLLALLEEGMAATSAPGAALPFCS